VIFDHDQTIPDRNLMSAKGSICPHGSLPKEVKELEVF